MLIHDLDCDNAREEYCRLLAACLREPAATLDQDCVFPSMFALASGLDAELARRTLRLGEAYLREPIDALRADYQRLFGSPAPLASPYAAAWLGDSAGELPSALLAMYDEGGFDAASAGVSPDHVAAELSFLHVLIYKEDQAQRIGTPDECDTLAALRQRFLDAHLGRWIGPFTDAMTQAAGTAFYRELAALTNRFVTMEQQAATPA